MKKLLTLTAVGVILTAPATAVQRCVGLDIDNSSCMFSASNSMAYKNKVNWDGTCTNVSQYISVSIRGIGVCSSTAASDQFETISSLSQTSVAGNINCWCKVVKPTETSWIAAHTSSNSYASADKCVQECAYQCATLLSNRNFLKSLVSDISD